MSIEVKPNFEGRVKSLTYSSPTFNIKIEVSVFLVRKKTDDNNIGTILENYRELVRDNQQANAMTMIAGKKTQLDNFINRIKYPFDDFNFEQLIVFYPADDIRKKILKSFADKLTSHIPNIASLDKSVAFTKVNPNSSVVLGLNQNDFKLDLTLNSPIKKLLLIDDTIDQGRTVSILLNKLVEQNLIAKDSEVKLICIYNNDKQPKIDLKSILKR